MDQEEVMKIDLDKVLRARMPGVYRFLPHSLVKWLERLICQDELNELLQANYGKQERNSARECLTRST